MLFYTIKKMFMCTQALRFFSDIDTAFESKSVSPMACDYCFKNNKDAKSLLAELIEDYFLFNKIVVNKDVLNGKKSDFLEFVTNNLVYFPSYEIPQILSLKKYRDDILGVVMHRMGNSPVFQSIISITEKNKKSKKKRNNHHESLDRPVEEKVVLLEHESLDEVVEVMPEKAIIFSFLEKRRRFITEYISPSTLYDHAEFTYKKYQSLSRSELFVCNLMHGGFYVPIFYSVRSGFFFTQLPKNVFMVDIDFIVDEKQARETTIKMYLDYLCDYARERRLAMKVSESTNGMHIYVYSSDMDRKQIIEHMVNLACDPDYASSIFNDATNGSVRISQKIFEKNVSGFGYSNNLETFDKIGRDFVEKPCAEFIELPLEHDELDKFMNIFTHLYGIVPILKETIISLTSVPYFLQFAYWLKINCKQYGYYEDFKKDATPFIYFLAQSIERNMCNFKTNYSVFIDQETFDVFGKMLISE